MAKNPADQNQAAALPPPPPSALPEAPKQHFALPAPTPKGTAPAGPLLHYICPMQSTSSSICPIGGECPFRHRAASPGGAKSTSAKGYRIVPASICVDHLLGRCANATTMHLMATRCAVGWHPKQAEFGNLEQYCQKVQSLVVGGGGMLLEKTHEASSSSASSSRTSRTSPTRGNAKASSPGRDGSETIILNIGPVGGGSIIEDEDWWMPCVILSGCTIFGIFLLYISFLILRHLIEPPYHSEHYLAMKYAAASVTGDGGGFTKPR